jgi:hypothetical protein
VRMQLVEGEVTPKDSQTGFAQRGCQRDEECGLAIRSGTVGQDEAVAGRACWNMKEAGNAGGSKVIKKREYARLAHLS